MSSAVPVAPRPASEVTRWDDEGDVVVVGLGCAGASAALGAAQEGATVVALDRTSGGGGASAQSGGFIYLGGGTPVQKACGFDDSPDNMYRFLVAACGPDAPEDKTSLYCEGSVDLFHWLVDQGLRFKSSFVADPLYEITGTDDGLAFSGGEEAWPFCDIATPAPRGHVAQVLGRGGVELMRVLLERVNGTSAITTRYDTSVDSLLLDGDGAVVGVAARQFGERKNVRARRGVVLAGGGFVFNDDMLRQYSPGLLGDECFKVGTDTDDGRSIRMAQALGADLRHMEAGEASCPAHPKLLYPSILVNGRGQRFINEDVYQGRSGQAALFHQGKQCFLITDEATFEANPSFLRISWAAETVAELEADMGFPDGCLQATVDLYNRNAAHGEDPLFHKQPRWLKPLEPPFGGIDLRGGWWGVFTLGGLNTLPGGEVLNVDGDAIAGLYAVGRTASGIPAWGYVSGISIGEGLFFGRHVGTRLGKGA